MRSSYLKHKWLSSNYNILVHYVIFGPKIQFPWRTHNAGKNGRKKKTISSKVNGWNMYNSSWYTIGRLEGLGVDRLSWRRSIYEVTKSLTPTWCHIINHWEPDKNLPANTIVFHNQYNNSTTIRREPLRLLNMHFNNYFLSVLFGEGCLLLFLFLVLWWF